MRVLQYCLGGGFGHLCRNLAVARTLKTQLGATIRLLAPARTFRWIDSDLEKSAPRITEPEEMTRWVRYQMAQFQPDLLIVDVFPRGVLGELPIDLPIPKVLLTRWVEPRYYQYPPVADALDSFQSIYTSEPFTGPDEIAKRAVCKVPPIVWTRPSDSVRESRKRLEGGTQPFLVALGSGPVVHQRKLRERLSSWCVAHDCQFKFLSSALGSEIRAVGRWLRGADLVVSAAGYQSYHEVIQAGVPTVFLPQQRKYDNQAGRALGDFGVAPVAMTRVASSPRELEQSLQELIGAARVAPTNFQGAEQVAEYVSRAL